MSDAFFRAGIGACVFDEKGRILVMRRKEPVAWQMPQGGIGFEETPIEALYREVGEEAGLVSHDIEIAGEVDEWLVYEVPHQNRNEKVGWGQVQRWFLCRLLAPPSAVRPDGIEFTMADWIPPAELMKRATDFRLGVYGKVMAALGALGAHRE